ncbi:MAG: type III-A CRISPR-associated RAMP protein Csm3 [Campylobacterota bacterium]
MLSKKIRVLTGLHIGISDDTMNIGGIDSAVIKREIYADKTTGEICFDPYEKNKLKENIKKLSEPYIPGSSLKGKIRSLLEWKFGLIDKQIKLSKNENSKLKKGAVIDSTFVNAIDDENSDETKLAKLIIKLFGESAGTNSNEEIKITRAIFRDCYITDSTRKLFLEDKIKLKEEKAENSINRVDIGANPRFIERVPSGVEFDFEVIIRNFADDNNELLEDTIKLGLLLLQNDALGGGGSRGNGRIEFDSLKENIEETFSLINNKLGIKENGNEGK